MRTLPPRPGIAALALLVALATTSTAPAQQVWPEELFDQNVFPNDSTPVRARDRLRSELAAYVARIDRDCRLTDAQKQKLQLAGRGDIQRFFTRYESLKEKFQLVKADRKQVEELQPAARRLRLILGRGLFLEDSLLYKVLANTLTKEQFARFKILETGRRAARHREMLEQVVIQVGAVESLRSAQRRELLKILLESGLLPISWSTRNGNQSYSRF